MEDSKIFREKSLEQLNAPEQLTEYLKVTGPGVWITLIGVIVLLCGLFFWGMMGTVISSVKVPAKVENGRVSCYVLTENMDEQDKEVDISIGDVSVTASTENLESRTMVPSDDRRLYASGYLSPGKNVYVLTADTILEDGFYEAEVTIEKLKPISLLFSQK